MADSIASSGVADFMRETWALTHRWFLRTARQPIAVVAGLFQPLIWLFLFGTIFRNMPMGDVRFDSANYTGFLAAGVIVFTAFSGALSSGVPVLFDKENQFLDRLLVAPLSSRYAIVFASAIHIVIMSLLQTALVLGVATWYGGVELTAGGVLGVAGVTALLIVGFTALSLGLAFALNAHFEMLSLIQVLALPAIFVSSALVPLALMPEWMQWPASLNPLTAAIEPVRAILLGNSPEVLLDAPWGRLGFAGCLVYLAAFDVLCLGGLAVFLRRFFRQ